MTITATSLDAALKELYAGQTVQNLVYDEKARPFLSMLKKMEGFQGVIYPLPVIWEDVGGRSAAFATAQTNIVASEIAQFQIDVAEQHGVARITTEAVLRSRGDKGAFLRGQKHKIDSMLNRLANSIEAQLFRDQSGTIGTVDSDGITSHVFTLDDTEDVVNFYKGQELVFASSTSAALRDSGTAATVSKVDRSSGEITMASTPSGATASDVIFNEGDYVSASDTNMIAGLESWLPSSTPGALFGVTRTGDRTRLAGTVVTGSSSDIEGSIIDGAHDLGRESNAAPDTALMSFTTYRKLVKELGAKVERPQGKEATGGFQYLYVYGPRGLIKCVPCAFCQNDIIWLLTMSSWQLVSMGPAVQIDELDGSKVQRVSNQSALEVRGFSFAQLACNAPGKNARINVA